MMLVLWVYVLTSAIFPGGERLMHLQASAFQAHMRAQLEGAPPRAATGPVTRFAGAPRTFAALAR